MRIKQFKKNKKYLTGYPGYDEADTEDKWYKIIDEIIEGFDSRMLLLDGVDNPTVGFDSKNGYSGEAWEKYYDAQTEWEHLLNSKWERGKELFFKFYSNFWD